MLITLQWPCCRFPLEEKIGWFCCKCWKNTIGRNKLFLITALMSYTMNEMSERQFSTVHSFSNQQEIPEKNSLVPSRWSTTLCEVWCIPLYPETLNFSSDFKMPAVCTNKYVRGQIHKPTLIIKETQHIHLKSNFWLGT